MIVLDASLLVASKLKGDVHHVAARDVFGAIDRGRWGEALLPDYVFVETMNVLAARKGLALAVEAGDQFLSAQGVELVPCSDLLMDAYEIFQRQSKPRLSLADAAIVAVARRHGAPFVATFDADFRTVEGIQVVPDQ